MRLASLILFFLFSLLSILVIEGRATCAGGTCIMLSDAIPGQANTVCQVVGLEECETCEPLDVVCWIRNLGCHLGNFIRMTVNAAYCNAIEPAGEAVKGLFEPILLLSLSVPLFDPSLSSSPYVARWLSGPMLSVYEDVQLGAYVLATVALTVSVIVVMIFDSAEKLGEALSTLKRSLLILALIAGLRILYDYSATLTLGFIDLVFTSHRDVWDRFMGQIAGSIVAAVTQFGLLGGWSFILAVLSVGFFLLVLAALKLLLMTVLAVLLPLALALTMVPLRPVREAGMSMISMLVNLHLATMLTAVVFRLGAEVAAAPAPSDVAAALLRIIVLFACSLAPAIGLVMAPRAGIVMTLTGMFLGYAARPAIEQAARQIWPQIAAAGEALQHAPYIGRIARPVARLYTITKTHPLGVYGYAVGRIYRAYVESKARRLLEGPSVPEHVWDVLEGRSKYTRIVKG